MRPISRICGTSNRCWRRLGSIMWRWSPGSSRPTRRDGFAWCDLGCGQGVTAAILAATHPAGMFHGIDAMPAHIDHARRLAAAAAIPNAAVSCRRFCRGDRSRIAAVRLHCRARRLYLDRPRGAARLAPVHRPAPQTGRPRLSRLQRDAGLGARSAVPGSGAASSAAPCPATMPRALPPPPSSPAALAEPASRHWRRASSSRNCRSGRKTIRRPISSTSSCPPHGSRSTSPRSEETWRRSASSRSAPRH